MGDRTVVDTAALAAAARTASARSVDVRGRVGESGSALTRLTGALAGARAAPEVAAVRQAAGGVLGDLAEALERLGHLLQAASDDYAQAEASATQPAPPVPAGPAAVPAGPAGPAGASGARRRPE